VSRDYRLPGLPAKAEIVAQLRHAVPEAIRPELRAKPVRSASGVAVITVFAKPFSCPHGTCVYCPGGPRFDTPQSYVQGEPGLRTAAAVGYDAYRQVQAKRELLWAQGHPLDKVELVVVGGTFLGYPLEYQRQFVQACYEGLVGTESPDLQTAQARAERSPVRNVGFTIETKPDLCKPSHVDLLLAYGATRVELGVQALDDGVLARVNRGHTVADVVEAFQCARDSGYKVGVHMMPGLPGATPASDFEGFRRLFEDPTFRPDMLKIYPTLVVPGTALERWFRAGWYRPYDVGTTIELLVAVKRLVPPWVRIMRIHREIPADAIAAGVSHGNLRQLVLDEVRRRGSRCRCIRCREAGLRRPSANPVTPVLSAERYEASNGTEVFLALEHPAEDVLIGFLRLRLPSEHAHRPEIRACRAALVRELHVYGTAVPLGARDAGGWQHRGFGRRLMAEAERFAREEYDRTKIVVISAVGTREYYRRLGYAREGPYMVKELA
jgi:elongator complex protein 3